MHDARYLADATRCAASRLGTCSSTTLTRSETTRCPTFRCTRSSCTCPAVRCAPAATARTRSRLGARREHRRRGGGHCDVLNASRAPAGTRSRVSAASGSSRAGATVSPRRQLLSLRAAHDTQGRPHRASPAQSRPRSSPIDFYNNATYFIFSTRGRGGPGLTYHFFFWNRTSVLPLLVSFVLPPMPKSRTKKTKIKK